MFNIRQEGDIIHNGISFYPLSNTHNAGFMIRFGKKNRDLMNLGNRLIRVRFSKSTKKWFTTFEKLQ